MTGQPAPALDIAHYLGVHGAQLHQLYAAQTAQQLASGLVSLNAAAADSRRPNLNTRWSLAVAEGKMMQAHGEACTAQPTLVLPSPDSPLAAWAEHGWPHQLQFLRPAAQLLSFAAFHMPQHTAPTTTKGHAEELQLLCAGVVSLKLPSVGSIPSADGRLPARMIGIRFAGMPPNQYQLIYHMDPSVLHALEALTDDAAMQLPQPDQVLRLQLRKQFSAAQRRADVHAGGTAQQAAREAAVWEAATAYCHLDYQSKLCALVDVRLEQLHLAGVPLPEGVNRRHREAHPELMSFMSRQQ